VQIQSPNTLEWLPARLHGQRHSVPRSPQPSTPRPDQPQPIMYGDQELHRARRTKKRSAEAARLGLRTHTRPSPDKLPLTCSTHIGVRYLVILSTSSLHHTLPRAAAQRIPIINPFYFSIIPYFNETLIHLLLPNLLLINSSIQYSHVLHLLTLPDTLTFLRSKPSETL
jgi:hypothetical protein